MSLALIVLGAPGGTPQFSAVVSERTQVSANRALPENPADWRTNLLPSDRPTGFEQLRLSGESETLFFRPRGQIRWIPSRNLLFYDDDTRSALSAQAGSSRHDVATQMVRMEPSHAKGGSATMLLAF